MKDFVDPKLYVLPKLKKIGHRMYYKISNEFYHGWFDITDISNFKECAISLLSLKNRVRKLRNKNGAFTNLWDIITTPVLIKVKKEDAPIVKTREQRVKEREEAFEFYMFTMKTMPVGSMSHNVRPFPQ